MADTTFNAGTLIESSWLNDVNDTVYTGLGGAQTPAAVRTAIDVPQRNGTGATGNWPVNAAGLSTPLVTTSGGSGANFADQAALFNGIKQAASETATGVVEKLTTAEAQAGTDNTRYHSASTLKDAQIQLRPLVVATGLNTVEFTSIPSWVKRITLMVNGISSSAGNLMAVQLGDSGGYETTGYYSTAVRFTGGALATVNESGAFLLSAFTSSAQVHAGSVVINRTSGQSWVATAMMGSQSGPILSFTTGSKTTSTTTDRIRLSTTGGDTFTGGEVTLSYE